jgi:acyl-CoA reductase-like NAD-dependent aldehyde dehydrogenase
MDIHKNWIAGQWSEGSTQVSELKMNPWKEDDSLAQLFEASPLDFVSSLPKIKDSHFKFSKWSEEQKLDFFLQLQNLIEENQIQIAESESLYQSLPFETCRASVLEVLRRVQGLVHVLSRGERPSSAPGKVSHRGTVLIAADWGLQFLMIGEALLPSLFNLNPAVILPALESTCSGQWWGRLLEKTNLPLGVVQIFQVKDEQKNFFFKHPSFKILFIDLNNRISPNFLSSIDLFQKKVALFAHPKSFIAILPGATDHQIREAARVFLSGMGQIRWNPTRLFFLEQEEKRLVDILTQEFESLFSAFPEKFSFNKGFRTPFLDKQKLNNLPRVKQQVIHEEGKVLFGGIIQEHGYGIPLLSLHLPNCSDLQRESHAHLVLTSVKYTHEFGKWINNLDVAEKLWFFGDAEKAEKLIPQIQVGSFAVNQKLEQGLGVFPGIKSSYFGEAFQMLDSPLWCYSPTRQKII